MFLANGNQPELSADGQRIAWIDGDRAKGRLRRGDASVYVIAKDVERAGGVHWLSDSEVAVVLRSGREKAWFGVALDGSRREILELTRLGTGGYECDVKLGEDGVWSYVADQGDRGRARGTGSGQASFTRTGRDRARSRGDR